MEGGAGVQNVSTLTMDCEDMFKEITKKLYGEEATVGVGVSVNVNVGVGGVVGVEFPAAERDLHDDDLRPEEHITAWGLAALMQNGFPPPGILQANFTPRTDPSAEDRWTAAEEPLAWAHSRVASYNPAQRLFKCTDCECVGFLARVAEHWLGTHSQARAFQCPLAGCGFASGWARAVRQHLARDHHSDPAAADHLLRDNPALDDLTRYLQRLKNKVETARTERRASPSGAGAGGAAAGGPDGSPGQPDGAGDGGKRYVCGACPYATDRRDLFTRHENIHRDEKPFHCYLCQKQFNRADHVKKHFLRMHRDQPYDMNRIRRAGGKQGTGASTVVVVTGSVSAVSSTGIAGVTGVTGVGGVAGVTGVTGVSGVGGVPGVTGVSGVSGVPSAGHYCGGVAGATSVAGVSSVVAGVTGVAGVGVGGKAGGEALGGAVLECRAPPVKMERAPLVKADAPPPVPHKAASTSPVRRKGERRYACCYCSWSGADNWCLKRHLNTHLKPFACALCEYKAARAERLATHVHKVHNKKACAKCPFLADDQHQLAHHLREVHHIESRNLKVPTGVTRAGGFAAGAAPGGGAAGGAGAGAGAGGAVRRREGRAAGAARLFGYLEASDGSGDEYEAPALGAEFAAGGAAAGAPHYARDKENAAPMHHAMHHDHCLRY
ncbi:uncharacterized protein chn [Epargyreus clarus]|uniref:uncharacterized protein chn n=1 Tax=Epargyreus clarus TaxID=520877 RepID=UPI003C2E3839